MGQGFEEFREQMKAGLEQLCGNRICVSLEDITKNNGVTRRGLVLEEKGGRVAAAIYLESQYEDFKKGRPVQELAGEVYRQFQASRGMEPALIEEVEDINDYEAVKNRIVYRLVNGERNREQLKEVPHIPFCDLAVVFCVMVETGEGYHASLPILEEHAERWGIDTGELFCQAMENTPRIFPPEIKSMQEVMKKIAEEYMGDKEAEQFMEGLYGVPTASPLYVMGNTAGVNGAAVILYPGVLKEFADKIGRDLVILPSSIHEVLLIPKEEKVDMEGLKDLVKHVNRAEVPEEEILSDEIYLYQRETDQVTRIFGGEPER